MKLILAILGALTRKAVAVTAVVLALLVATFVWNWARAQTRVARQVAEAQARVESQLADWRARKTELLRVESRLAALRAEEPSWFSPVERLHWEARVAAAEKAVEATRLARDGALASWEESKAALISVQEGVDRSWVALTEAARQTGWQLGLVVLLVFAGPLGWKAVWYYGLAALAGRRPPARVSGPEAPGWVRAGPAAKCLEVPVAAGQPLLARMDWVQQYSPDLRKRTRFLFDWRSPFTSYAAGLAEMTELGAREAGQNGSALLNAADDPNAYLIALELRDHVGIVLKPGAVVAVSGEIQLRPRWHWRSLHHWIAGRLRHILFAGTGTVYVAGHGGVEACGTAAPVVIEEALVLGYDSRAAFATVRTETFWPYFRDKTSLFDYQFAGGAVVVRQTTATRASRRRGNVFVRTVDAILGGIGRLLGL